MLHFSLSISLSLSLCKFISVLFFYKFISYLIQCISHSRSFPVVKFLFFFFWKAFFCNHLQELCQIRNIGRGKGKGHQKEKYIYIHNRTLIRHVLWCYIEFKSLAVADQYRLYILWNLQYTRPTFVHKQSNILIFLLVKVNKERGSYDF